MFSCSCILSNNWYLIFVAMKTVFFAKILYRRQFLSSLNADITISNYYTHFCIPYLPVSYKIWTYFQYIDNTKEIVLIHIKQQDLMPFYIPNNRSNKILYELTNFTFTCVRCMAQRFWLAYCLVVSLNDDSKNLKMQIAYACY